MTKAFTERRPKVIGAIAIVLILTLVGLAFAAGGLLKSSYPLSAIFTDTAGLQHGDYILVAGARAGQVGSIQQRGDRVEVGLDMDNGVQLPVDTTAAISVETLLGVKVITLAAGSDWDHLLQPGDVITKTSTPTELLTLQGTATHLLNNSNGANLNQLIQSLASVTKGKQAQVATIVTGLNKLTTTVNQRTAEVGQLIDSANTLAQTLSDRRQQLVSVIDNLNVVVAGLAQRRAALADLLQQTEAAATQTASLVGDNKAKLDSILAELQVDLDIVGRNQVNLAQGVSYLAQAVQGFASIGFSGPANFPNTWANIFTQTPGLDAILGGCGEVATALDLALGPDPLPCSQRTGPVPTGGAGIPSNQAAPTPPGQAQTSSAAIPSGPIGPMAVPEPDRSTTSAALAQLLVRLTGDLSPGGRP